MRYGTPQTKEHIFWERLLDWSEITIRIPLIPGWMRNKIATKVSETARF